MAFMVSFSSKAVKKAFGEWLARQGPLASLNSEGEHHQLWVKVAVSLIGPIMVMERGLSVPE